MTLVAGFIAYLSEWKNVINFHRFFLKIKKKTLKMVESQ